MPLIAIVCGILLVAVSLVSHLHPEVLGTPPEKDSPTVWIPAGFGLILFLAGLVSLLAPGARKHAMHMGAMAGLLGVLGGALMPIVKLAKGTLNTEGTPFRAQLLLAVISLVFLLFCIRSFIAARKARQAKG